MEVRNTNFAAFIDIFTSNTYVMVIMSDPTIRKYFKYLYTIQIQYRLYICIFFLNIFNTAEYVFEKLYLYIILFCICILWKHIKVFYILYFSINNERLKIFCILYFIFQILRQSILLQNTKNCHPFHFKYKIRNTFM